MHGSRTAKAASFPMQIFLGSTVSPLIKEVTFGCSFDQWRFTIVGRKIRNTSIVLGPVSITLFPFEMIERGDIGKRCSKWSDMKTVTFENASFSIEAWKTELVENATTTTTTDLAPNTQSKGNVRIKEMITNGNGTIETPSFLCQALLAKTK